MSEEALMKRYNQGWLKEYYRDVDEVISRLSKARRNREVTSIGYLGNVVTLWERLAGLLETDGEMLVELGSDQTSCHNPFNGGYYPVQIGYDEAREVSLSFIYEKLVSCLQGRGSRQCRALLVVEIFRLKYYFFLRVNDKLSLYP